MKSERENQFIYFRFVIVLSLNTNDREGIVRKIKRKRVIILHEFPLRLPNAFVRTRMHFLDSSTLHNCKRIDVRITDFGTFSAGYSHFTRAMIIIPYFLCLLFHAGLFSSQINKYPQRRT